MAVISLTADLLDLLLSTHLLNSIKSDSFSGVSGLKFNNPGHVWKAFVEDVEYDEQRVLNSYHNSLFNCCLVSKSWYRSSVKSLWREPLFRDDHIATRFLSLPGDHRYFLSSLVKSLRVREFPFQRQTFQPITTNTLIRLIKETSETLRQLVIGPGTYRTKLNDGFFKDLLKISLPNLEDFSIFNGGCSGMSSTQFIETCCSDHSRSGERGMLFSKPLKSISLIDCGWLGDAVLTELVLSTYRSSLSSATTLDQLVHLELDLSYMNADQGLDVLVELLVKDNGVDGGGGRCRLESLALPWIDLVGDDQDVHHHIEITPETTEYIPPFIRLIKCMGQTLKSLSLAHANLKPDTLLQLSHWCPKLTILDLGQCGNLCDAMVESMTAFQLSIEFLGRITHLSVSACPLSKHGLQLLILHCQRLIYLDISLFPLSVTDDLIYFMSRHSHSLEVVNLDHCSGVSAAALVWLVIRLKRLEFICLSPSSRWHRDPVVAELTHRKHSFKTADCDAEYSLSSSPTSSTHSSFSTLSIFSCTPRHDTHPTTPLQRDIRNLTSNAAECKIQQIEKPFPWVHDHEGGGGGGGGGGVLVSSWEPVKALARVLKKFYQVENETTESCATRKQKQMDNVNHVLRIDANGGEEEEFCEFMRFTLFHDQVICRNSCEDHTIETGTVSAAAAALG